MTHRFLAALLILILGVSCSTGARTDPGQEPPTPSATPTPNTTPEDGESDTAYDYDAPIPTRPAPLAAELETLSSELNTQIARWVEAGTEPGTDARPVLLRAVRQQRIYRNLLDHPRVYAK